VQSTTADLFARARSLIEQGRQENGDSPMVVATAGADGMPSARVVLLKAFDARGPVFYTNYRSHKGRDLTANPRAELLFYWPGLGQQLRIAGAVETVDSATADAYWKTRSRESQIGSAASAQSEPLEKAELLQRIAELTERCKGREVPRPAHWSGYRVLPGAIEFWHAGVNRVHDRERWTLAADGSWEGRSIAP
jgi:pyridoxamine 5'-phosphate oxidase